MRIHKKRNAVIAAVTGAALLMGGSTYALWSASANLGETQIQAGDLSIHALGVTTDDISPEVIDSETASHITILGMGVLTPDNRVVRHGVLLTDTFIDSGQSNVNNAPGWKAAPGDTILIITNFTVNLKGDNLVAKLEASFDPDTSDPFAVSLKDHVSVQYGMYYGEGKYIPIHSVTDPYSSPVAVSAQFHTLPTVDDMRVYLSSRDDTIATDQTENVTPMANPGQTVFFLTTFITFNDSMADQGRDGTNDLLTLEKSTKLTLTQVRG